MTEDRRPMSWRWFAALAVGLAVVSAIYVKESADNHVQLRSQRAVLTCVEDWSHKTASRNQAMASIRDKQLALIQQQLDLLNGLIIDAIHRRKNVAGEAKAFPSLIGRLKAEQAKLAAEQAAHPLPPNPVLACRVK